jgi:hypothetical protein
MSNKKAAPPSADDSSHEDLQKVNERLRRVITSLQGDRTRPETSVAPAVTPVPARGSSAAMGPALTPVPMAAAAGDGDVHERRLAVELAAARDEAQRLRAERDRLAGRLALIEAEHRRVCDDYVAVQEQSNASARLYVALEQLHGGTTREDVLAALQEIVVNLIGSEEFGIYERRGERLALVHAVGFDRHRRAEATAGEGALGRAASVGELWVAGGEGGPPAKLAAAVPLRAGTRVWGVLGIFRLLGHKPSLDENDQALLDLLAAHAGLALALRTPGAPAVAKA